MVLLMALYLLTLDLTSSFRFIHQFCCCCFCSCHGRLYLVSRLTLVLICQAAWKSDLLFWYLLVEMLPAVKRLCFALSFIVGGNLFKPLAHSLSWPLLAAAFHHKAWRQRMANWIPVLGYILVSQFKFVDLQRVRNVFPSLVPASNCKAAMALNASPLQSLERWHEKQQCPWSFCWTSWKSDLLHGAGILLSPRCEMFRMLGNEGDQVNVWRMYMFISI